MKKLIAILFFILAFTACSSDVQMSKDDYEKLLIKAGVEKEVYSKPWKLFIKENNNVFSGQTGIVYASDGHQYLVIDYGLNKQVIMHYIDCEFCKKRIDSTHAKGWSLN